MILIHITETRPDGRIAIRDVDVPSLSISADGAAALNAVEAHIDALPPATPPRTRAGIQAAYLPIYAAGFLYGGRYFSLAKENVGVFTAALVVRDSLAYPRKMTAIDGKTVSLASANEVAVFYATGLARYEAIATEEQAELDGVPE